MKCKKLVIIPGASPFIKLEAHTNIDDLPIYSFEFIYDNSPVSDTEEIKLDETGGIHHGFITINPSDKNTCVTFNYGNVLHDIDESIIYTMFIYDIITFLVDENIDDISEYVDDFCDQKHRNLMIQNIIYDSLIHYIESYSKNDEPLLAMLNMFHKCENTIKNMEYHRRLLDPNIIEICLKTIELVEELRKRIPLYLGNGNSFIFDNIRDEFNNSFTLSHQCGFEFDSPEEQKPIFMADHVEIYL